MNKGERDRNRRVGATTVAAVPPHVLEALEAGTLETATLAEGLAIDFDRLMAAMAPELAARDSVGEGGIVQRMARAGALLREAGSAILDAFARHPSDTVRGWAAFAYGQDSRLAPDERIARMRPFAADAHFGVREWAWMAVRPTVVAEPERALALLAPWTADADPNVRRFASEATRPRGVWAAAIPLLRREPSHGLAVLEQLRHDPSRYVEDSVANWVNDAVKDNPGWVADLLERWRAQAVSPRLLKRAGRSLAPKRDQRSE